MKLKTDDDGNPLIVDGHPVYENDDGSTVNVPQLAESLAKANSDAAANRVEVKNLKAQLKLVEGIDPVEAKQALAFKKALGDKIDPDKVEHQLAELEATRAGLAQQVEEQAAKLKAADETIDGLTVGSAITGSEFIRTKVVPALQDPVLFRAAYGANIAKDESGNPVFKDAAGNTIMSEKNPGKPAGIDEALPKIVTNPKHLQDGNASGGGGGNGGRPVTNTNANKSFKELSRAEQVAAIRKGTEAGHKVEEIVAG